MDDMAELALGLYMPGFMNDGADRVVEQQLIAAQEHHDIQGNDEQEHMAAYEMLGPYMRAAGALMELEPFGECSEGEDNTNEGHEMAVNEGHEMAIAAPEKQIEQHQQMAAYAMLEFSEGEDNANERHEMAVNEGHAMAIAAPEQQDTQGIEQQQKEPHASAVEDNTNKGHHLLGRMMAYLTLIINLQAACRRFIQRAKDKKDKNVCFFEEIPGTRKKDKGQRKATFSCKCCLPSRFGKESVDGTWPLDLERAVGWKNPISMRLSNKEFEKGCRDHVGSKNGRHRFWETVERVDKMLTSGSASPSQQDRENLAAGGEILEKLQEYEESWKYYEKIGKGGKEIKDYEEQKKRVKTKFEQARRVLEKLQIEIRPLPKKRKAPAACADELPNSAPAVELVAAAAAKVNTNDASLNMILKQIEAQGGQLRVLEQAAWQHPEIRLNGLDQRLPGHRHGSASSVSLKHQSSTPSTINIYLGIIYSTLSDSAKTICLTAMLREEDSAKIISCFAGEQGKWNTTAGHFDGVPLWPVVADKMVVVMEVNSGVSEEIAKYRQNSKGSTRRSTSPLAIAEPFERSNGSARTSTT